MRDLSRIRGEGHYWLTRAQLSALGVSTLSLAALAFFVGLMIGRKQAAAEGEVPVVSNNLISGDVEGDALTELLVRVEQANANPRPAFSFPEQLQDPSPEVRVPEPPAPESDPISAVIEVDEREIPEPPEPPAEEIEMEVPSAGWAVQIAAYPTPEEADARILELQGGGHKAYRISALVKGSTWYRVRVGPYMSKEAAATAREALVVALNQNDLMVTEVR